MEFPKDFGIQGQWIPVTPAKPIPIKTPPPPATMAGPNWVDAADVDRASGAPWSAQNHGGELRTMVFNSEGVTQMPYRRLLAINDPAIASRMNLAPFAIARMGGKIPSVPNPQCRMQSFPFLPNLNSLPENNMASRVVSNAMASPATPREIIDLDGENLGEQCFSNQVESSQVATCQHQEGERNVVVNSSEEVTAQQAEGENQDIDLNKTPSQKLRRKKYMPKVIREGKPATTPKPATPKPAQTVENSSGKRKYVRKKKDGSPQETPINPQETPTSALGEIVDQESRSGNKPVRRSLNFDLENSQAQAEDQLLGSASMMYRHNVVETQGREAHVVAEAIVSSRTRTTVQCSQGQGPAVLQSSMGCGVGFGLNSLRNQFASENVRIPQTPNQPPQPSRQEMMKTKWQNDFARMVNSMRSSQQPARRELENLKKFARMMNCQNIPGNHERHSQVGQSPIDSNKKSGVLLQGAKRNYNLVDNAHNAANMSFVQANNGTGRANRNYDASSTDTCFPDDQKRRRVENGQKELTPNASSTSACTPPSGWKTIHTMQSATKVFTLADAQRLMVLAKRQPLKHMWEFNPAERETNDRQVQGQRPISTPTKLSGHYKMDCNQPPTPEKEPGYSNGQENENYGPQARVEVLVANQMKSKARRWRKKEQDPLVNSMATNANQKEHVAAACTIGYCPTNELAPQRSGKNTAHLGTNPVQICHISSNYKASAHPGIQSEALVSYRDPVEEIVRKLRHLNINGVHEVVSVQPQNALVPYAGGNGTMVPFEGPFDPIKKRKPRPKVDLDPESNRVWKLLMGKESSEGEEGTDMDKEKWWEEERRVFRGRADSFIARMHLIQGDRRFSRWKGSVVDSVIGVFLTQNVSDHLSSSAFMCLAAKFPPQSKGNNKTPNVETISRPIFVNDTTSWQGEVSVPEFCSQSSLGINEPEQMDNKETAKSNESLESNTGGSIIDYSKESCLDFHEIELGMGHESPDSALGTTGTVTSCTSAVEGDDRKSLEENSVASSQNSSECPGQTTDHIKMSPLLNFEADELLTGGKSNGFSSFRELLEMANGRVLNDQKATGSERILSAEHSGITDWSASLHIDKSPLVPNGPACLNGSGPSYTPNSNLHPAQHDFSSLLCAPSSSYRYQNFSSSRFVGMEKADVVIDRFMKRNQSYLPPSAFEFNGRNVNETVGRQEYSCTGSSTYNMVQNDPFNAKIAPSADAFGQISKNPTQPITSKHFCCQSEVSSKKNVSDICLNQQDGNGVMFQHRDSEAELHMERTQKAVETQAQILNGENLQTCSNSPKNNQKDNLVAGGTVEPNLRHEVYSSQKVSAETLSNVATGKKVKAETEKKTYDWDSLRKQAYRNGSKKEQNIDTMDSLDYEAVRNADVHEISNTIRERGMNNLLAERIKDFLNRLVRDHGSIDLEWLRDVPPDKAKDYLLSIRGLGLKSVECVRLLTLHHLAFPVDTNVGRIAVRLGWVPLQPLPESLQLHLLEMYPILETIQKYLWPRLCKLDQRTLYELHYQLITFGKVFCTKSKPNCNSCPMRGECKHFASAFASARLALPGPEEKRLVSSETRLFSDRSHGSVSIPMSLPQLEGSTFSQQHTVSGNCEPIIEEPATPEPECIETSEIDIEDAFYNDPDEIPTIKLNFEEFTQNLQNYMQENNMGLQDGDMSKALVAISPEVASIPTPKLKNVNRLRTEHQVYELPDSHPLLEGLDKREPDDPCPYLLAIWTPGETAQSIEPPTACCNSQDTGKLCDKNTCFSCNSIRESQAQMVRGTLLIPCRTANRGSFPLNGTYFQVNEVFADHDSSRNPIDVPRDWIWNLPRRTVYFGTSIPSIFKGLTTEGIQHCFWRGFVCVRGFDRTSRAPRPLFARLHFPASKVTRNKTPTAAREQE